MVTGTVAAILAFVGSATGAQIAIFLFKCFAGMAVKRTTSKVLKRTAATNRKRAARGGKGTDAAKQKELQGDAEVLERLASY